jgi:hypothetical protein
MNTTDQNTLPDNDEPAPWETDGAETAPPAAEPAAPEKAAKSGKTKSGASHYAVYSDSESLADVIGFGFTTENKNIRLDLRAIPVNGVFDLVIADESLIRDVETAGPHFIAKRPPDEVEEDRAATTGRKTYWVNIGKGTYLNGTTQRLRVELKAIPREFLIFLGPPLGANADKDGQR